MTAAYKDVVMIGGPNGAGKTTAATTLLPKMLAIREFVNADEIARGLSPFNPEGSALAAGRLMIERMHELIRNGESFAFETTCSGRGHARTLLECRKAGYRLTLIFLWLPSPKVALTRVARRVAQGGHRIPEDVVIRRYTAGLKNLQQLYLPIADIAYIYDNTDRGGVLIAERQPGSLLVVRDDRRWKLILEAGRD
jgi:predicted ABC-type ATPase